MSFNYVVGQINASLERLVFYYRAFMERTEAAFRGMHERVLRLEEQQSWQGPSDEQVERVLRKIFAERFADPGVQHTRTHAMKDGDTFVKPKKGDAIIPLPIDISLESLQVDPKAMPSQQYAETLNMLEHKLPSFPELHLSKPAGKERGDKEDIKPPSGDYRGPKLPPINPPPHDSHW